MKYFVFTIAYTFNFIVVVHAQQNLQLWYNHPAKMWEECVPLGNGRLGSMPDCGVFNENIVLNDITLWSGGPQDDNKTGAVKYLTEIRKLLFEGKIAEAEELVKKEFLVKGAGTGSGKGANLPYGCYQVLGNLHLKYDYGTDTSFLKPQNYIRALSLDSAVAKCSYQLNGVTYRREYFASFSNDVIIIRLSADRPGKISFTLSLDRPERYQTTVHGRGLDMSGQLNNGTDGKGMRYLTRVQIKPDGGRLIAVDSAIEIKNADAAMIYISSATDFRKMPYKEKTDSLLKAAMKRSYKDELTAHVSAYQKLFNRASLDLDNKNLKQAALPTDERLAAFAKNPTDNGLPVLYFQFGRYLLISSTRPGVLPPNLQGLWANTIQTPWNGDYHLNINIEMNHWPLDVTNLPMLNEPFYTLVKRLLKPGEKTAKAYWDSKGWVAYSSTNVWGYTSPGSGPSWGTSPSGSGWLCNVLWSHYAFTQDRVYLIKIYPIIKGAAEFYLNTLVRDPNNGWLVTAPSNSAENSFILPNGKRVSVCAGPTMDNQVIRELFTHVIEAGRVLHTGPLFTKQLADAKKQLAPNQIDKNGRLMEWLQPYKETEPHHRHLSPLWGLYPGNEITPERTPALAKASKSLLIRRGDISTGWSLAWKMNLWARLKDGNHAFKLLKYLLSPTMEKDHGTIGGVYPNLFDACPPFQIDGNFGGTAGIAEMLIQSHTEFIEFLPALPNQWADGSFTNFCVRGGGVASAKWQNHKLQNATLFAAKGNHFRIKTPEGAKVIITINKKIVRPLYSKGIIDLDLKKDQTVNFNFEY